MTTSRLLSALAGAAALPVLAFAVLAQGQTVRTLPDPAMTPGAVNPTVTQDNIGSNICVRGWTKTVRPVVEYTQAVKRQQMIACWNGFNAEFGSGSITSPLGRSASDFSDRNLS